MEGEKRKETFRLRRDQLGEAHIKRLSCIKTQMKRQNPKQPKYLQTDNEKWVT